jgi:hypothetical protein
MLSVYVEKNEDLLDCPTNIDLYIVLSDEFNKKISIPTRTKELKLGHCFKHNVNLPEGLTHLTIAHNNNLIFPKSLIYLKVKLPCKIKSFPENLTHLILPSNWMYPINDLPASLEFLELGNNCNVSLDNLPINIKKIIIGTYFRGSVNNLPINLKEIICKGNFKIDKVPFDCKVKYSYSY